MFGLLVHEVNAATKRLTWGMSCLVRSISPGIGSKMIPPLDTVVTAMAASLPLRNDETYVICKVKIKVIIPV